MKKTLDRDMDGYRILGACNPKMAWEALGLEPRVGAMRPCNVILREVDGGVEVYVKIGGEMHYLWRAVDHEGEVLEAYVTKTRDRKAALRLLRKAMKRFGQPETIVTDRLRSYSAAFKNLGIQHRQETGRWLNNRAENSHLPFRRRERAMQRFRRMRSLQKFVAVHSSVHNLFNLERHLNKRQNFKESRTAALSEWRQLGAT